MSTQTLIFWLTLILLAIITVLVWLAISGYAIGYILLAILGTVLLVGLGEIFSLIRDKIAAQRQQQQFMDNAHENLSIMQALQGIQNKQNQAMLQQIEQLKRLPQPQPQQPNFDTLLRIEDGVFSELED
jgi:glucan phosphoethanolaminetransferase (alkaline phosphatase superfamily)